MRRADVFYAGKAFLCTEVARWIRDEGLFLDVCTGGELAVAIRAGVPARASGCTATTRASPRSAPALEYGISRIIVDSFEEIERVSAVAAELGIVAPVLVRVTVGVEAHTHEFIATAHEDQKFGFSLAGGHAIEAVRRVLARPHALQLLGLHSHIGSQIFDTSGFEVVRPTGARPARWTWRASSVSSCPSSTSVAASGSPTPASTTRSPRRPSPPAWPRSSSASAGPTAVAIPRISIEPGRAIAGPSTFTLYEVGTVKPVELDGGASRLYVSVDGGMSDNVRTALYDADYSCTLANRRSDAAPVLGRVVGKHCESGDIVVMDEFLPDDVGPGDLIAVPGTGAYCRSLSSQYNHTPRPPVIAVRDGVARVIVRRETIDDLLALDV